MYVSVKNDENLLFRLSHLIHSFNTYINFYNKQHLSISANLGNAKHNCKLKRSDHKIEKGHHETPGSASIGLSKQVCAPKCLKFT